MLVDPSAHLSILRGANVQDWESVEYLPPVEAGYRYGFAASSSAIVLWSRGRGPWASEARNRR